MVHSNGGSYEQKCEKTLQSLDSHKFKIMPRLYLPKAIVERSILGFCMLTVAVNSSGQQSPIPFNANDIQNTRDVIYSNKIKKELTFSYIMSKSKIKDSILTTSIEYDSTGRQVKIINNVTHSNLRYTCTYYYTKNPRRLFRIQEDHEGPEPHTFFTDFEYDSLGNQLLSYTYNTDTTRLIAKRKIYDEQSRVIETYDNATRDGGFVLTNKYFYSNDAEPVKDEIYSTDGSLYRTDFYEFDSVAHKKIKYSVEKDKRRKAAETVYDDRKRWIKHTIWNVYSTTTHHSGMEPTVLTAEYPTSNEFLYNPDGTLFQRKEYGVKYIDITRHYYQKY